MLRMKKFQRPSTVNVIRAKSSKTEHNRVKVII